MVNRAPSCYALLHLHITHSPQALESTASNNDRTAVTLHHALSPAESSNFTRHSRTLSFPGLLSGALSSSGWPTQPEFAGMEFLRVMSRLPRAMTTRNSYIHLCRKPEVHAVNVTEKVICSGDQVNRVRAQRDPGMAGHGGAPMRPGAPRAAVRNRSASNEDILPVWETGAGMGRHRDGARARHVREGEEDRGS